MASVGAAIAATIGLAVPAYGQSGSTSATSSVNAGQPATQVRSDTQPPVSGPATPPQTTPGTPPGPATAPAPNAQPGTGPAPSTPPETTSAAADSAETRQAIAKGVRRTADGRLAFSGSQLAAVELPGGRKRGVKSVLNVSKPLSYGEYVWDDKGVAKGRIWILVDPARQLISVFRGKDEIGTAVTLYGADEFPTPTGHFRILGRTKDHRSRKYDNAPMPYTLWLTKDGVAIHGNNVLEGYASHGCVGVPLEFARRLFAQAKLGDEVFILRYERAKPKDK